VEISVFRAMMIWKPGSLENFTRYVFAEEILMMNMMEKCKT
jgi:hypothetical protein